jgi:hypothetical protein
MKSSNLLFTASWVILLVVSSAIILLSLQSLRIAYSGSGDTLTQDYTLTQIAEQGGEPAAKAFRGRRVTAATWALAFGAMALAVVWIPYRRGERWAWWALLVSLGVSQLLSLARAIALASTVGTGAPAVLLAFLLLGLLAAVPRMFIGPDAIRSVKAK